jgi:hypothetical protein
MDLQTAMTVVSLAGAAASTGATVYFWFVRVRSERARLTCELVERELYLAGMTEQTRQVGLKLGLVVANGSSLPNALLGVKVRVKLRDGGWLEAEKVAFDKVTPRPINVTAMQTTFLVVNAYLSFASVSELEQGGKTLAAYADHYLANPREIEVELKGLNNRRFPCVVAYERAA